MGKYRALPEGHMTVGEVAKKMNTTVRTLQYYDKEGIFSPSTISEGGRRLYNDKDIIKLHQIQSMRYLGFSLGDIKNRLILLDAPADVAAMLTEHAANVREKIAALSESLQAIEALKSEVLQMQTVDYKKYADIIINLQLKNEFYGVIKHFDEKTLDYIRSRFDLESGPVMVDTINRLFGELAKYNKSGILPESEEGQELAKEFWDMVIEFTGGDMSLFPGLLKLADNMDSTNDKWSNAKPFLEKSLQSYFTIQGINPFEGVEQ
ncbi:MAG: MerR family transcriptional regulator [Eubacteriaceae bacterium]|nr:MerR family transcriptional regulator [Eubacteriaceae bacterium]